MNAAGYILTGLRKYRRRAHPPMILFHSLTSEFFGIEEREAYYPDFESFWVVPVSAGVLRHCQRTDHLAGQTCIDEFAYWRPARSTTGFLCTRNEARRAARAVALARSQPERCP